MSRIRGPMSDLPRHRRTRDVRSPSGTSEPPWARSPATHSSPTWASSDAVAPRAIGASAPTTSTGAAGWPPTRLGAAAQWAADGGCDEWVIVTEATNPAGRVYRSLGFEPDTGNVQAYRKQIGRASCR